MRPYLLDTNVLIALAWPNHIHYQEAVAWFAAKATSAFGTCPITQTGFVRISSNPAFTTCSVTPGEALDVLRRITSLPGHEFWPDDVPAVDAFNGLPAIAGHRQVTDAYLLQLASHHGGALATFDRAVTALARASGAELELIS